jgi:SAM-dependent methyltransferase
MGARRLRQRKPTRNGMGWTSERLNRVNQAFVDYCAQGGCPADAPGLDVGAGFGAATVAALAAGGWVIANDIAAEHLAEVARRAEAYSGRLTLRHGALADDLHFDAGSLGAIHCASVLHFLTGRKLERAFRQFALWLRPGGRLFIHAATPFQAPFARFVPEFERRLGAGEVWPGWVANTREYSEHRLLVQMPTSLHLLDPTVLRRLAGSHGFAVEDVFLYRRGDLPPSLHYDGRESVGLLANL